MQLDHIIWATTTPKKDAEWIASWSGVRPVAGGVHAGHGTRNDLSGLPMRRVMLKFSILTRHNPMKITLPAH